MRLKKMKCHKCGKDLEKIGDSSFGKCPECGRKMLFREWRKFTED